MLVRRTGGAGGLSSSIGPQSRVSRTRLDLDSSDTGWKQDLPDWWRKERRGFISGLAQQPSLWKPEKRCGAGTFSALRHPTHPSLVRLSSSQSHRFRPFPFFTVTQSSLLPSRSESQSLFFLHLKEIAEIAENDASSSCYRITGLAARLLLIGRRGEGEKADASTFPTTCNIYLCLSCT